MKSKKYYANHLVYKNTLGTSRKYGLLTLGSEASRVSWYVLALLALASGLILWFVPEVIVIGIK